MGYVTSDGGYVHSQPSGAIAAPQTAVTTAGATGAVEVGGRHTARLTLAVTAMSGTSPALTVNIQTSPDGATWSTVASFNPATAVGSQAKAFAALDRYVRAQWAAPGGTSASFSFAITGELV